MRLSDATRKQLRETGRWLSGIEEGGPPALPEFLGRLRGLLDTDATVGLGVVRRAEALELDGFAWAGESVEPGPLLPELARWFGGSAQRWALWTPTRPEPAQRNVVLNVGQYERTLMRAADPNSGISRRIGMARNAVAEAVAGLERVAALPEVRRQVISRHQLRVLVCDGPSLLAWVGAVQDAPFSSQQVQILRALVGPLQRRLALERKLGLQQLYAGALPAAMEAIAGAAFLVGPAGTILHANTAGQRWRDRDEAALREKIRRAVLSASRNEELSVTPVNGRGMPACFLLVQTRRTRGLFEAAAHAVTRWSLTAREAEVLERLARGDANKTIASALGCSVRTVELHVTHILAKAGVESRSELVAALAELG